MAISITFIIYGVFLLVLPWHSFKGIDAGRKSNYEIKIGYWHSVYVYHVAYRIFSEILFIIDAVFGLLSLAGIYLAFGSHMISLTRFGIPDHWLRTQGLSDYAINKLYLIYVIGSPLPTGLFPILFIRKIIQINDLDISEGPITTITQLIPLVIGSYILFNTVMGILEQPFLSLVHRYWSS